MFQKGIHVFLFGFQNIFHRSRYGADFIDVGLNSDLVPDCPLIGTEAVRGFQIFVHRGVLDPPELGGHDVARLLKMGGAVGPAAMLGAAYGNDRFRHFLEQDGGVQHPVLLGTRELLAVEKQNGFLCPVDDLQFRHRSALRHFGHREKLFLHGLLHG